MNTTQKPLVIEKPSPKLLEFVRGLERQKAETSKEMISKKDKYFHQINNKYPLFYVIFIQPYLKYCAMCILTRTIEFIKNGFFVFSGSAKGKYDVQAKGIDILRSEFLNRESNSYATDKKNLNEDKKAIASDIRKSFNKVVSGI